MVTDLAGSRNFDDRNSDNVLLSLQEETLRRPPRNAAMLIKIRPNDSTYAKIIKQTREREGPIFIVESYFKTILSNVLRC